MTHELPFQIKLTICFLFLIPYWSIAQIPSVEQFLKKSGIHFTKSESFDHFKQSYDLVIDQPLDHFKRHSKTFKQRVKLNFVDSLRPVLLVTEGYEMWNTGAYELSPILGANEIVVEHRFFGQSQPDSLEWDKLNLKQVTADYHRLVEIMKQYFKGKWVSTGISKGGQTCMIYKRNYPDDVQVCIPYVGPLNFSKEDPRVYSFLENVGSDKCRKKIDDFQRYLLKHGAEFIPLLKKKAIQFGYTFSLPIEKVFEYDVLEYSFSFWQWGGSCPSIPDTLAGNTILFNHLISISGIDYWSDQEYKRMQPFFYQALTEMGYYGYDIQKFKGLLKYVDQSGYEFTFPKHLRPEFNPKLMLDLDEWLKLNGNNFIYIYGEKDTWTSTAVEIGNRTNSLKFVVPDANHGTARIKNMPWEQKKQLYDVLERWLGVNVYRIF